MQDKEIELNRLLHYLEEKQISSKKVYEGSLLHVYEDEIELPDKKPSAREWIEHPGASAVVPVFEDGTIMLVKQYRYPPRKLFIEVPAGKIDKGESPQTTATRELQEECGILCERLEKAGDFFPAIGYSDEIIHVYVAWGLKMQEQNVDDDEFLLNYRLSFSEALRMIEAGDIDDGKTICSLIQASLWWKKNEPFKVKLEG